MIFYPESTKNTLAPFEKDALLSAMQNNTILESRALVCDNSKNLHFKFGDLTAIMPYTECALSIDGGEIRDIAILSRVGLRTCFIIEDFTANGLILSRKKAQQRCLNEYVDTLCCGDVISARITHIENFGAFCDIGCGITALLPIDSMSVSRITSPYDRFVVGQEIYCVVKSRDEKNRIILSTKELFGTWLENAANFSVGETVLGVVRSVESYGIFVELAPNLAGLAESSSNIECGQTVSVFIKNIQPEKMKIKLSILHSVDTAMPLYNNFTKTSGHISKWLYSTAESTRKIESLFD